jgi:malate/lactate dehydrogenase
MNPKLKPPGAERLKLKYYQLLSTSAFKFNLRRYNELDKMTVRIQNAGTEVVEAKVGP